MVTLYTSPHTSVSKTRHLNNTTLSDQRKRSVVTLHTPHSSVSETRHQTCAHADSTDCMSAGGARWRR